MALSLIGPQKLDDLQVKHIRDMYLYPYIYSSNSIKNITVLIKWHFRLLGLRNSTICRRDIYVICIYIHIYIYISISISIYSSSFIMSTDIRDMYLYPYLYLYIAPVVQ